MKKLMVAVVLTGLTAGLQPARAASGCSVISPTQSGQGNCRYIATGPGQYTVGAGINSWRIQVTRDNGLHWITLAAGRPLIDDRTPSVYPDDSQAPPIFIPAPGSIATQAGDLVDVSMNLQNVCTSTCSGMRFGYLSANDS